ncbi:MAG: peptidoglycan editing factor PgeF [Deltaproteobacteria bacterium]|nr:peptidoglycan editing factor PgeF [Deltaproteobacteria bacterium]
MRPVTSPLLRRAARVRHGFFTRGTAPLDLDRVAAELGVGSPALAMVRQVHAAQVFEVTRSTLAACDDREADALWTEEPELAVVVRTADCVPMLATTADGALAAAVHGGWRGLAAGVIEATASALQARGHQARRLWVAIGPHIGPCCYRVGPEVLAALGPHSRVERGGQLYADLGAVARERWLGCGVPREQIDLVNPCTACDARRFFSYRRDHGGSGRQLSAIMRTP